jgi:UDP-N-acetylmuramate dehydrogenase
LTLRVHEGVALAAWTTLGLGGPARRFVEADDVVSLEDALAAEEGAPVLVLGGGSNLVVADEGFAGTVVRIGIPGKRYTDEGDSVVVAAGAGESWGALVEECVGEGLSGIECLSGIPGLVGAAPVQNVGAYGQEVAQTITDVHVWDRDARRARSLAPRDCHFGYRESAFKRTARYVVTSVTFRLERSKMSGPLQYAELAARLGLEVGQRAPLETTAQAVLDLRRAKGMVLDSNDPDTRSAGSFFTNPLLSDSQLARLQTIAPDVPVFAAGAGAKVAAAWLVEKAGFSRGYRKGGAAISSKHALALTARQGGSTAELMALAREIREGVLARFGVTLEPEPQLVGVHL